MKTAANRLSRSGIKAVSRAAKTRWRSYRAAKKRGDRRTARRLLGKPLGNA